MKISRETARQLGLEPPRPVRKSPAGNDGLFAQLCEAHGVPAPESEHKFHPERRWRFDRCWPASRLALEIQGGVWSGGRHVRGAALLREYEKLNAAVLLGWSVLFCTPQQVDDGSIFPVIRTVLEART